MWDRIEEGDYESLEGGIFVCGEKYSVRAVIVVEDLSGRDFPTAEYCVTFTVKSLLVHTVFACDRDSAMDIYERVRQEISDFLLSDEGASLDRDSITDGQRNWCESFIERLNSPEFSDSMYNSLLSPEKLNKLLRFGGYGSLDERHLLRCTNCGKDLLSKPKNLRLVTYIRGDGEILSTRFIYDNDMCSYFLYMARKVYGFYYGNIMRRMSPTRSIVRGDRLELYDGSQVTVVKIEENELVCKLFELGRRKGRERPPQVLDSIDISAVVLRNLVDDGNPRYSFIDRPFHAAPPRKTYVAGTRYYDAADYVPKLKYGGACELRFEPDNEYDDFAIEVLGEDGTKLGYIPRNVNRKVGAFLEKDRLICKISGYRVHGSEEGVTVSIEIAFEIKDA